MSISRESLRGISTSFATASVGTPNDPLPKKLEAISAAGFQAIELAFPDLLSHASKLHNREIKEDDYGNLITAAADVAKLCKANNLSIVMLQPFSNFEGWPEGSEKREDGFKRAKNWIKIMEAAGTDMLQVGSSDSPNIASSFEALAADLRQLADMLAPHKYRVAYENWCWATRASTWKQVWEIVKLVDRPNIGLCLDTFQIAGGEWADPTTQSGLIEDQGPQAKLEHSFSSSLDELSNTIPKEKMYLLQISDAYKLKIPLDKDPDEDGLRPRGRWSHDFRPYPYNGGFLPVEKVTRAVLRTGTRCCFSMEVFDSGPDGKGARDYDFKEYTKGAMKGLVKLLDECADL